MANLLAGCATLGWGGADPRPRLLVHGREWNAPLVNPDPSRYGIDQLAGCIVQAEFRVEIDQLAYDASTDRLRLGGRLLDAGSGLGTFAILRTRDGSGASVATAVHAGAPFALDLPLAQNPVLAIERIGARTLEVDLRVLARRAAPAGPRNPSREWRGGWK